MSPLKFFLLLLFVCALFLYLYGYFLFHPLPFTKTIEEETVVALQEANIPFKDRVALLAQDTLSRGEIERFLTVNHEGVYYFLSKNPSLSPSDFRVLWNASFSFADGERIRATLLLYQKLEAQTVEQILNAGFEYAYWSALTQNSFLSQEQFDKLISSTPPEFRESFIRWHKRSSDREQISEDLRQQERVK